MGNHDKFNSCLTGAIGISSACSECYAVTADYGFKNCKAACLLGWCKEGCLSCTAPAQTDLPACTGIPTGSPTPCLEAVSTGACSTDDQAALADPQSVGDKQNKCGTQNLGLSGIQHDCFVSCVEPDLGISAACTECYHTVADYGFKNCKAACLLGWCKSGCLSCTQPAQDALPACTGFSPAVAKPCDSVASAGACTADDQSALADAQVVGESQDKCGKKCLSLTGIDHDCFVSCVEGDLGIRPPALSAITQWRTTASRTARPLACWDGASQAVCHARSQRRTRFQHALASLQQLRSLATVLPAPVPAPRMISPPLRMLRWWASRRTNVARSA